jgi:predicted signal transduction protein with EAL and GGDEF domain
VTTWPTRSCGARTTWSASRSPPRPVDVDAPQLAELLDGQVPAYEIEKRFTHALGHLVWVLVNVSLVRDDKGRPLQLIAQVQDISERKALEGRLEHLVDHDFLTALFNGRRFEQALAQETTVAARYGGGGAVLVLDLDHFKAVNDKLGHRAGDDLLRTVAAELRSQIRALCANHLTIRRDDMPKDLAVRP